MESEHTSNKKIDALIIGSGLSGLTSAMKIKQKEPSLKVRILEASNKVGGQLRQVSLGEIGAKWISEDQCHIYRLLKTLKVQMHKRNFLSPHLKTYECINEGVFSRLAKYEIQRYINELELKLEFYKPIARKRKDDFMHNHINKRLFFNSSRKYMRNLVLLISGVEANSVRIGDFLAICYTAGGIKRIVDLVIKAPNYSLLEFSSQELLNKLIQSLESTEILFGRKVIEVNQYREYVEVKDSMNECHLADTIILAVSWNFVQEINFWPPLPLELQIPPSPTDRDKFIMTSFLINYTEGFWRQKGFSGNFIKLEPFLVGREYRPTVYFGFMIHEEGIEPLIKSVVLHELAKIYGDDMLLPQEYLQRSFDLNNMAHLPLTTPWNRLIWSSSAAAGTCYRGYLGGAVQSGLRAAMNALLICRPQSVAWQDIAEIQCHDFLRRREATRIALFFSSFNLYNVSSYTFFICGLLFTLTKVYRKHLLNST